MFLELTKIYRWKTGDNRLGLEGVVTNLFPVALGIADKLLVDPNLAAATMLVQILKAYKSAIAVSPLNSGCGLTLDGITTSVTGGSSVDSVG